MNGEPFSTEDVKRVTYSPHLECYVGFFDKEYEFETPEGTVSVIGVKMNAAEEIVTTEDIKL